MGKSYLQRLTPAAPRWRAIDWPFAVSGDAPPRVAVLVLGGDDFEAKEIELERYFTDLAKKAKEAKKPIPAVRSTSEAWQTRDRAELVYRAFRELDDDGQPSEKHIAADVDEIVALPPQVRDVLYTEWASVQADVAPPKYGQKDLDELVAHLKKKRPSEVLGGWPSTLLIALITTLVDQSGASTEGS